MTARWRDTVPRKGARFATAAHWFLVLSSAGVLALCCLTAAKVDSWLNMGRQMLRTMPEFRDMQRRCPCEPSCHCCNCRPLE